MGRKSIERALAETIFKKEQHLDPTDAADFNAEDFGFSKLDGHQQAFYFNARGLGLLLVMQYGLDAAR